MNLKSATTFKCTYPDNGLCIASVNDVNEVDVPVTRTAAESPATQPNTPNWKKDAVEKLSVAGRFARTILAKLPECVDTNPVKVAASVVKTIIDIKNVSNRLCTHPHPSPDYFSSRRLVKIKTHLPRLSKNQGPCLRSWYKHSIYVLRRASKRNEKFLRSTCRSRGAS